MKRITLIPFNVCYLGLTPPHAAAKAEVARLYQRWEELEALKQELEG